MTTFDTEAKTHLFFDNWVCKFGMPSKKICNWDPRFTSLFWSGLMKLLSVKVALSIV